MSAKKIIYKIFLIGFAMYPRLASNLTSCFILLISGISGITGMQCHDWLFFKRIFNYPYAIFKTVVVAHFFKS